MSAEERILTLHPKESKSGVNINRQKYDLMREAIVETLREEGQLTFQQLREVLEGRLEGQFEGSIGWYYTTVKLDLEARGIVKRVGYGSPQHLQLETQQKEGSQ